MNLDLLAIAAHPDDVELSCGGTLLRMAQQGYKTGILDLTAGEMGTRGTRKREPRKLPRPAKYCGFRGAGFWAFRIPTCRRVARTNCCWPRRSASYAPRR